MSKKVDSQALGLVNRALGLTGAGSGITEFMDGILDQNFDVGPIVRRGQTLAGTDGVFMAVADNVHAGAGDLTTVIAPFAFGTGVIAPFPDPLPNHLDLWLLGATLQQVGGTGTVEAVVRLNFPGSLQGFGIDDSGVAVVVASSITVAFWDTIQAGPGQSFGLQNVQFPFARINLRLPRATTISLSSTASALITFRFHMLLGLFPVALGQDVVVG